MSWAALVSLLNKLFDAWKSAVIRKENKEAQGERDAVESNAGEWFNGHFGGVQPPTDKATETDADKTNP